MVWDQTQTEPKPSPIRNPSAFGLFLALIFSWIPFVGWVGLYMAVRYMTGNYSAQGRTRWGEIMAIVTVVCESLALFLMAYAIAALTIAILFASPVRPVVIYRVTPSPAPVVYPYAACNLLDQESGLCAP